MINTNNDKFDYKNNKLLLGSLSSKIRDELIRVNPNAIGCNETKVIELANRVIQDRHSLNELLSMTNNINGVSNKRELERLLNQKETQVYLTDMVNNVLKRDDTLY